MPLTADQLETMKFGYLTGADLLQFCSPQLLISRWNVNNSNLKRGCDFAYSEIIRNLSTRYDVTDEIKNSRLVSNVATATVTAGVITGFTGIVGGLYSGVPAIVITDTGGGSGAEALAVLTGTAMADITILSGGQAYVSPVVSADQRENLLVQVAAVIAVRKILGNLEKLSDEMKSNFKWAEDNLMDLRNGQMNLMLPDVARVQASTACLVRSRFRTIG